MARYCCMCLPLPHQERDSYHSGEESFANIRFVNIFSYPSDSTSFHIISDHFVSFRFISCHFMPFQIILCHFKSFYVISYHFRSFHIISYRFYQPHFIRFDGTMRNDTVWSLSGAQRHNCTSAICIHMHWRYSWWINWDISLVRQILKQGGFISINMIQYWMCGDVTWRKWNSDIHQDQAGTSHIQFF